MLWTEALMAALRIIKRLDVEGVALLLAVLEEDLRASSPIIELTAHGRQQLLNRSAGGAAGRHQQGGGPGGGGSVPILPSAFLNVAELRAHPNFLKFVETSLDFGRRRRMAGEIILLILWSRGINGALPVLKHILQLVLPLALTDPSEEALVAGGACLAAVNAQTRREDLLAFIPDVCSPSLSVRCGCLHAYSRSDFFKWRCMPLSMYVVRGSLQSAFPRRAVFLSPVCLYSLQGGRASLRLRAAVLACSRGFTPTQGTAKPVWGLLLVPLWCSVFRVCILFYAGECASRGGMGVDEPHSLPSEPHLSRSSCLCIPCK